MEQVKFVAVAFCEWPIAMCKKCTTVLAADPLLAGTKQFNSVRQLLSRLAIHWLDTSVKPIPGRSFRGSNNTHEGMGKSSGQSGL